MSTILKKSDIHLLIMFALMFGVRFLPPFGLITPEGMQVLGVFVGAIYGWITIGLMLPSLVATVAMTTSPAITATDFLAQGFGSQIFLMMLCFSFIVAFMFDANISELIVSWILNLKIAQGRPWITFFCFFAVSFIFGLLGINLLALVLLVPLYVDIVKKVGLSDYHKLNYVFMIGLLLSMALGNVAVPFNMFVMLIVNGFTATTGITLDLGTYTLVVFPFAVVTMLVYVLICKFILRIDTTALRNMDFSSTKIEPSKHKVVSLFIIILLLATLAASSLLPETWYISKVLTNMGFGGISAAFVVLLLVIRIDGKPLMNFSSVCTKINWDIIIMCGCFTPITTLLGAENVGINATVSALVTPIVGNLSPLALVMFAVIASAVLTNFLNNLVVALIFSSIIGTMASSLGEISLYAVVVLIIFASSFAFVLPSGNQTTAFAFGFKEVVKAKDLIIFALLIFVIMMIFTCTIGWIYFSVLL